MFDWQASVLSRIAQLEERAAQLESAARRVRAQVERLRVVVGPQKACKRGFSEVGCRDGLRPVGYRR